MFDEGLYCRCAMNVSRWIGVSLYTLRLTDPALNRLIQMPRDAKSTYAKATLVGNGRVGATFS